MNRLQKYTLAASLALTLTGTAWATTSDAWLTTKAKLTLLTTEGVSASAINVDTVNGQVSLHGKVKDSAERNRAQDVVGKIDGVKGVRNLLQVVPTGVAEIVQASDDEVKQRAEDALKADGSLAASDIKVQSVNAGVVLVAGTAKTLTDHLHAVEVVASVPGVKRVASEIQSPNTLGDAEVWRDQKGMPSAKDMQSSAADMWITSATKMRLLADGETPALEINVDTNKGVVTLFGIVPTARAKAAAEKDAAKVSGVKRVVNELQIVADSKKPAVAAKDGEVEHQVELALRNHDEFKNVSVEVKNGVARLTGKVSSSIDRIQAASLARSLPGVRSIQDDLQVVATN